MRIFCLKNWIDFFVFTSWKIISDRYHREYHCEKTFSKFSLRYYLIKSTKYRVENGSTFPFQFCTFMNEWSAEDGMIWLVNHFNYHALNRVFRVLSHARKVHSWHYSASLTIQMLGKNFTFQRQLIAKGDNHIPFT